MSSGQARSIKLTGDRLRSFFKKQCTNEYGRIKKELLVGLSNQYSEGSFVLKSGSNWQFHLGSFSPFTENWGCLLYTSPSPRDRQKSRMPSSA